MFTENNLHPVRFACLEFTGATGLRSGTGKKKSFQKLYHQNYGFELLGKRIICCTRESGAKLVT
jgi:hypothetical protein